MLHAKKKNPADRQDKILPDHHEPADRFPEYIISSCLLRTLFLFLHATGWLAFGAFLLFGRFVRYGENGNRGGDQKKGNK
jgi:hypothetical protein